MKRTLMNKWTAWMLALAAFSGSALLAQDVTGVWQGTLQIQNRELRAVVKIAKDDAVLKATFYSIDQSPQGLPGSVNVQGTAVKITIPGMGGTYDGKLSADGKTMTGSLTQGPMPLPLNLTHVTPETAWAIPEPPAKLKPMPADANPSFEVATIKPSKPGAPGIGLGVQNGRVMTRNTPLSYLMTFAYSLHPRQISGGPAWFDSEKFDLEAKPDIEGQPDERQLKLMMQKLLADRFKLTFHRENKELSVYALTVAKIGTKLTPSAGDPNGLPGLGFRALGKLVVRNASMENFVHLMQSNVLDRPVVDQTGLKGRYDFTLDWTPDEFQFAGMGMKAPAAPEDAKDPDLFTAIQQQLGLKLEGTKAAVENLVIDHVEKPSEN